MIQGSRISSAYLAVTPLVFLVMYNLLVCVESVLLKSNFYIIYGCLVLTGLAVLPGVMIGTSSCHISYGCDKMCSLGGC